VLIPGHFDDLTAACVASFLRIFRIPYSFDESTFEQVVADESYDDVEEVPETDAGSDDESAVDDDEDMDSDFEDSFDCSTEEDTGTSTDVSVIGDIDLLLDDEDYKYTDYI